MSVAGGGPGAAGGVTANAGGRGATFAGLFSESRAAIVTGRCIGAVRFSQLETHLSLANCMRVSPVAAAPPRISLRGVTFRYRGTDTHVLHDVDLDLPAVASVAIVGENGVGRTTLVKLLCRFYAPDSGTITVDGVDSQSLDVEVWRAQLAGGFQDFARLELKLRESVGVG